MFKNIIIELHDGKKLVNNPYIGLNQMTIEGLKHCLEPSGSYCVYKDEYNYDFIDVREVNKIYHEED
ncbi:D5 protein [Bacillus phage vB_BcgM]|nr:D5 protein [Bacillus phage vB_BcgM]